MGFLFGLDLGQVSDYSALVLVERTPAQWLEEPMKRPVKIPAQYAVRFVHRWPLGTSYPDVVKSVAHFLAREPVSGTGTLVLDQTGVGRPVLDMIRKAGLPVIAVSIHGGDQVSGSGRDFRVPKRDLVGVVQVLLQQGRLKMARQMPLMDTLFHELVNFRVTIDPVTAHDGYSAWRERDHDDVVLALALACWRGEEWGEKRMVTYPIHVYDVG